MVGLISFFNYSATVLIIFCKKCALIFGENINLFKKRHLYTSVNLSHDQKKEIDLYFKQNYGKKVSHKWHRLYQSYLGTYDKRYFPEILFSTKLELLMNPFWASQVLGDKNLLDIMFNNIEGVRCPKTIVSCMEGVYRDHSTIIISENRAVELLADIGEVVVKKTIDTSSGRDVKIYDFSNGRDKGSDICVEKALQQMGNNLIVQEKVKQCKELSDIYPYSLNTFRVITYIMNDSIYCAPIVLKLGRNGSKIDNIHYGGLGIGIKDNGYLRSIAFSEYQERFEKHPDTKVVFSKIKITKLDDLIEAAKKMHSKIPLMRLLSWDLCIDEVESVVVIELNTAGQGIWLTQMVNGEALFADNTEYMLRLISNR